MNPCQYEAIAMPTCAPAARLREQLEGVELALIDARNRIMTTLERELAEVRSWKKRALGLDTVTKPMRAPKAVATHELLPAPGPLPENVVPLTRAAFRASPALPAEVSLDPELERATIEELNAALAAAFSQMSAH